MFLNYGCYNLDLCVPEISQEQRHIKKLTNSKEQSVSWESHSHSASPETPPCLLESEGSFHLSSSWTTELSKWDDLCSTVARHVSYFFYGERC